METAAEASRGKSLMEELTPKQRSFVLKQRLLQILDTLMHDFSGPAHHLSYIEQCQGDMGMMALHYGRVQSVNNLLHCFLSPVVGSLSDSVGRRKLHAYGKLGPMLWFLGLVSMTKWYSAFPGSATVRAQTLAFRFALEMIPWGTLMAGNWGLFASQHADYFAEQPELSARIQAADNVWRDALGIPGSLFGAFVVPRLWHTRWRYLPWLLSAATAGSQVLVALSIEETLPAAHRKKWTSQRLREANPFSNIMLLLRNGPGLRGLTCAYTAFAASQSTWSIQSMYRLGPLGWSSGEQGYFEVPNNFVRSFCGDKLVMPFLKRAGNRVAFQQGALVGALSYFLMAVSWMPRGASKARMAVQYCFAMFLLQSFPSACLHAIKAMMINQGVTVCDVGKGKLVAAQSGLGSIAGIVMPAFVWAPLFKFFQSSGGEAKSLSWLRWGPGGHFFVSGGCLLLASLTLRLTTGLVASDANQQKEKVANSNDISSP